ncbi:MAG: TVP38/TMEM64 family protein [Lachnospiraceae bacterium]|nr:TVP38/TMEM64 family protein [Lachnospiraceae bacterium]
MKKIVFFISLLLLAAATDRILGSSDRIMESLEHIAGGRNTASLMVVLLYMGITVVGCVLLTLPGITFAVSAGLLFGPLWGTIWCSVATTAGAALAFLLGRYFLKESLEPVIEKNRYLRKWLLEDTDKKGIILLMITRLIPLFPYNLQNFAYGTTNISFFSYVLYSFLFMLPGTTMYTVGGAALTDRENRMLYVSIAVLMAFAVTGVGIVLKKRYFGEGNETEEQAAFCREEDV